MKKIILLITIIFTSCSIQHTIENKRDTYCPCGKYGDYIPCNECKE
jgi:hypothetical protein